MRKKVRFCALWALVSALSACGGADSSADSPGAYEQRLDLESARFLGAKYLPDPLGEGAGLDADPLLREDAFDCVTYVETIMARAAPGDVLENKIRVSYLGENADYIHRKHFWELDQAQSGAVHDITAKLGAPLSTAGGVIDKKAWFLKKAPPVQTDFAPREIRLDYIAAADVSKMDFDKAPRVSIIGVIADSARMPESIGTNNWNRHVGIMVKNAGGTVVVRHASSAAGRVIEQPFAEFVGQQMSLKDRIGIKIWGISQDGER
jgi:hypothetical protein